MSGYGNGKYGTQTLENVGSNDYTPPPKGSKLKQHFRRFWWLHLINFLIGTLIVTLILVYVGMPSIAQNGINDAWLTLEDQRVENPSPNGVHVFMNTTAHSKSMFHPQLDPFRAALFLEDTLPELRPFGYLDIPALKATAAATVIVNQEMTIASADEFARYNQVVMTSETYRVALRGRTGLKEGSFPKTNVDFNKVVTSKGLNNLKGFAVRDISISLMPEKDGTNMRGKVFIPNPSPITIFMGTVTQNVMVDGKSIAVATIPNMTLRPGNNLIDMTSVSDQATVISMITSKYKDGKIPVQITGNRSVVNGVELPYFTKTLRALKLETTLDLAAALKATGLDLNALSGGGSGGGSGAGLGSASSASGATAPKASAVPLVSTNSLAVTPKPASAPAAGSPAVAPASPAL